MNISARIRRPRRRVAPLGHPSASWCWSCWPSWPCA